MALIKKNQLNYGKEHVDRSILKSSSQKFKLDLCIPKDKIEEEIRLLKNELMKEAEAYRLSLEKEKENLISKEMALDEKIRNVEKEKQSFFSDIEATKQRVIKDAYDEGYAKGNNQGIADGLVKGEAQGRADHDKARKNYEDALYGLINKFKELDEYKKEILTNTEPYLIALLDVIVKKLLSRSIEIDKNIMLEVVREALVPVTSGHDLTIKVNPENVQHLEDNKAKLLSEFMSIKECKIVGDADVSQGGCLIEANFGIIDSRIESKMQSIKDLICSIKDCDKPALMDTKVAEEIAATVPTSDDIFKDNDDLLSFGDSLGVDNFDFLTDDDE